MIEQKTITGKKIHMSQVFTLDGKIIPVTVIKTEDSLSQDLENQAVTLSGISKGKGFAGAIKKWNFRRQPATRGQSNKERAPGSIGAQTPGRVFKGKKMAGRLGGKRVTVKGLRVVKVNTTAKELLVSGPVPGARNSEVVLKFN